jgi:hypothetical protein
MAAMIDPSLSPEQAPPVSGLAPAAGSDGLLADFATHFGREPALESETRRRLRRFEQAWIVAAL